MATSGAISPVNNERPSLSFANRRSQSTGLATDDRTSFIGTPSLDSRRTTRTTGALWCAKKHRMPISLIRLRLGVRRVPPTLPFTGPRRVGYKLRNDTIRGSGAMGCWRHRGAAWPKSLGLRTTSRNDDQRWFRVAKPSHKQPRTIFSKLRTPVNRRRQVC